MSSTPILGMNGNGNVGQPTARVEDMISLFRPTKVRFFNLAKKLRARY